MTDEPPENEEVVDTDRTVSPSTALRDDSQINSSEPKAASNSTFARNYELRRKTNLSYVDFAEIAFKEKVGHGSYGVVYKAVWRDHYVAVKEFGPKTEQKAIEIEVKQLSRVQHPNIIALYGIAANQLSQYLIMEYAEGGSLYDFLHGKIKPYYSTAHAMSWARQCAEGVAHLHAMKPKPLIHRDLKPLNLLLTDKGRCLKICDFGTVTDKATLMTNNKGSAAWMAPEVFEGSKYTEKCDIFSWAIVLWEMLSRQKPFHDVDNTYSIMWKIHKGDRPPPIPNCPEPIQKLMTSCWATKPELRPSMQHVVDVMNELVLAFPGADKPLDYEFVNQQIVSSTLKEDSGDNYELNFTTYSSIINSRRLSSTNMTDISTESNLMDMEINTSDTPIINTSTLTTPTIETIPEEDDSNCLSHSNDDIKFICTPSTKAAARYETIHNNMIQMASVPMPALTVAIESNAWEIDGTNETLAEVLVKDTESNEREFTVGKNITTMIKMASPKHNPISTSAVSNADNIIKELSTTEPQDIKEPLDDTEEGNSQSWLEMLDPDLQPEPPLKDNVESQQIYQEHKRLAKTFLQVDTNLYYARDFKKKFLADLNPNDRKEKEELLQKLNEKEELMELYNTLKQQLDTLQSEAENESTESSKKEKSDNQDDDNTVSDNNWVIISHNPDV